MLTAAKRRRQALFTNNMGGGIGPVAAAIARLKAVSGLEALYLPYIPGQTPNFVGTGFASAWPDSSGKGRDLLQASGAAQPTINADGSLTTNGTTMFMATAAFDVPQPAAMLIRGKVILFGSTGGLFCGNSALTGILQRGTSPGLQAFSVASSVQNAIDVTDAVRNYTGALNGASSICGIDETEVVGTLTSGGILGGLTLGGRGGGVNLSSAKFGLGLLISGALTLGQRQQIRADMKILTDAAGIS